jgi:protein involved in polysaccharide export with SLBB domain
LTQKESLDDLINYSGGLPVTAQTTKVNISRITPADKRSNDVLANRELITFDYQEAKNSKNKTFIQDGDKITFFPILDLEINQVSISGHVYEPGTYSLNSFKDLKSLIKQAAKGIKEETYMQRVDVTSRLDGFNSTETLNSYNLADILSSKKIVNLNDLDNVVVYSVENVEGSKTVSISGYGVEDLTTTWKENLSIYDLIFSATEINNPEFLADLLKSRIDIKRYNNETGDFNTLKFEFNNLEELKSALLYPRDNVKLFSVSTTKNIDKQVGMYGLVKNPDMYDLEENMYIEDLILLSGGFLISSDQENLTINRPDLDPLNERIVRKFNLQIDKDYLLGLKDSPDNGFILEDKDIVVVKEILGFQEAVRIDVIGEVNFPQSVVTEFKSTNLGDLLDYAGGLTKYANLDASYLERDGKIISNDFNKLNAKQLFEDGDKIYIASNKGIVSTTGAISSESTFIWDKGIRAKKYIKNSGGKLNKIAGKSYVILPNGKSKKIGFFKNPKILPNSTIIVAFKEEKEEKGKFLDNFNQTFGLIASTITTILLASKL